VIDELQLDAARQRQLEPLVEVTTQAEAELALSAGATLIGVNVRDLDTLAIHPTRAASVLAELPGEVTAVHLSGLTTPEDVARVARSRADAALIGEALVRQDDPEPLLSAMVRPLVESHARWRNAACVHAWPRWGHLRPRLRTAAWVAISRSVWVPRSPTASARG
jgi:hypothetical protein